MKVRLPLLIILTLIGVVSVSGLLIQHYNLFTAKDIPALSDTADSTTVVDVKQSDNNIQHRSQPTSTFRLRPQKSEQTKTINKPTSARRDKMVKAEANSKLVDFTKPAADYSQSIEKFRLAVKEAESAIEDLEKINY